MPEKDAEKKSAQRAIDAKLYDRAVGSPFTKVFEQTISKKLGDVPVLAINSGTGALVMALKTLSIGPGDEVIVPAFCSFFTISSILSVGATPVFVDVRLRDYAIDPAAIEKKLTARTKAIMVVHLFGQPALGIGEVLKIAKKKFLPVIENAAQAFGAKIKIDGKQRFVGTLGDIGCFTFFSTIPFTNGKGVSIMVFQNKEQLYTLAKKLRAARANNVPGEGEVADVLTRLNSFDKRLDQRRKLAEFYTKQLGGVQGIILSANHLEIENVWHRYVIRVARRDEFFEYLSRTMPAGHHFHSAARFFALKKEHAPDDFPISKQAASEIIFLPMFTTTAREEATQVVQLIRAFFQK